MSAFRDDNEELLALEESLKRQLRIVPPRKDFVGALRKKLENSPILQERRRLAATMLSIALGLVAGLVIFLIGRGFMQGAKKA
jgi:hypothetical protein